MKRISLYFVLTIALLISIVCANSIVYGAVREIENNDRFADANSIVVNDTVHGICTDPLDDEYSEDYGYCNDEDYYKFEAPSNGYITIAFTHVRDEGEHWAQLYEEKKSYFTMLIEGALSKKTSQKIG